MNIPSVVATEYRWPKLQNFWEWVVLAVVDVDGKSDP